MDSCAWTLKLATLDKRLKAFVNGYCRNVALLGDDSQEISYLLEIYFSQNKTNELVQIHTSGAYLGQREFFKSVVFSVLSSSGSQEDSIDGLINLSEGFLPLTADFIKQCLKKNKITFSDVIEVINKFITESKRRCIFIIEEFPDLAALFDDFYQIFSKFIILQRNCSVILASSEPKTAEKILACEFNLLFGNFERVNLNESSYLDNYVHMRKLLGAVPASAFLLSFLVKISGSNALYYDILSDDLKKNYCGQDEETWLISTLAKSLGSKQTYLFQKFIKKIDYLSIHFKDPTCTIRLLLLLVDGYLRKKELISLRLYDSKELNQCLAKLVELNYIENLGNIYKVKDALFSFWLGYVFRFHFGLAVLDHSRRWALSKRKLSQDLSLFKEDFLNDKVKKVLRLFNSFKNDTLRLGKNRYSLPEVERTKVISYPQKSFHLLVGEGQEIIFVGISEKNTDGNDISEFIERVSSIKGKKVKKIFISLSELSTEARLVAKNNKLIVWDINECNRLLDVYNRPPVSLSREKEIFDHESLSNI